MNEDTTLTSVVPNRLRTLRARMAPFVKAALLRTGGYGAIRRLAPSRQVAILRYHAICGEEGYRYADPSICISPGAFERHVSYLARCYSVLPLPEVADRLRARRPLPLNSVAITFDDGYADNLVAARTLHRHGLSATFFITAGCMTGGEPFWPAEIRALVSLLREPVLQLTSDGLPIEVPVGDVLDRRLAVKTLTRLFKTATIPVREALREQLRTAAGNPLMPECMLRWEDLAEMQRLGMTIGAHTLTHPNLPSAGLEAATLEIEGSKGRLERELGEPVTLFSYPNGGADCYVTPELQRVVRDSGYLAATTSHNALASAASDPYALERVEVEERVEDLAFALEVERFAFKPTAR